MSLTRVLLVDDHAVVRAGIRALLDSDARVTVVGDAGTAGDAVRMTSELSPDVVLLDLSLGEQSGIGIMADIRAAHPAARVIALTVHGEPSFLRAFLAGGGAGYVLKDAPIEELHAAIRTVMAGRSYISINLREGGLAPPSLSPTQRGLEGLSRREREVLQHVAYGFTNEEIGTRLGLSVKTIEGYRSRIVDKLSLKSRADIVRFALEHGLVVAGRGPIES
jgi:two-component system, NarL family, response regulator NreC